MAHGFATSLMFKGSAEAAMNLYKSLFKGAEMGAIERYGPDEHGAECSVKRAEFRLGDQRMIFSDSPVSHDFSFTPSMSIFVECADEAELDAAYKGLSEKGAVLMPPDNYGFSTKFTWVNDPFGVSWQLNLT